MKQNHLVWYYLILSILAVALLLITVLVSSQTCHVVSFVEKSVVAVVFSGCCVIGIFLAWYPGWLRRLRTRKTTHTMIQRKAVTTRQRYQGHHPTCDQFKSHTILLNTKRYCAGCLGLSLGAALSLLLMIVFLFTPNMFYCYQYYGIFAIGLLLLGFSFVEVTIPVSSSLLHILSPIILVISFLLITVSVFMITRNIFDGLLAILFSILWLMTRNQLSLWNHTKTCIKCTETCKAY